MAILNDITNETLAELAGGTEHGMSTAEVRAFRTALVNMGHGDEDTSIIPESRWLKALDHARREVAES